MNEVEEYLNGRYLSSTEAYWKLYDYSMSQQSPAVVPIIVHLPEEQMVYFEDHNAESALERKKNTMITSFFEVNKKERDKKPTMKERKIVNGKPASLMKDLLLHDVPKYFTYKDGTWKRKVILKNELTIGRLHYVNPKEGDRYYLRILLTKRTNVISYEDLRTIDNITYPNFKEACIAMGLLKDDLTVMELFEELSTTSSDAYQLRNTFVTLLLHETPASPLKIWERFKKIFCEDFTYKRIQSFIAFTGLKINSDPIAIDYHKALCEINKSIMDQTGDEKNAHTYNLPLAWSVGGTVDSDDEHPFDYIDAAVQVKANRSSMNLQQGKVFDEVTKSINLYMYNLQNGIPFSNDEHIFFLEGSAGCGY